jgi:hypothetical protein
VKCTISRYNDKAMGWMIGVRFLAWAGNFSLRHPVQNGTGDHSTSYPMGTRGSFPGGKATEGVKLPTHLHLVPKSKNAWSYPSTSTIRLHGVVLSWAQGQLYLYGLDDRGSRVRFPAGAGNFSLHHRVQHGSEAHPASYPTGTGGSFAGGKATGAWSCPLTSI